MTVLADRKRRKDAALRYIGRMRSTDKREYAIRYFNHLTGLEHDPEPVGLSVMAAQAVRMRLHDIFYPREQD